jgi:hypothetical protein
MLNRSGTAVGAGDTPTPDPYCIGLDFDCYVAYGFKSRRFKTISSGLFPSVMCHRSAQSQGQEQ